MPDLQREEGDHRWQRQELLNSPIKECARGERALWRLGGLVLQLRGDGYRDSVP